MNANVGLGLALIAVARYHLVPALTSGTIQKTMGKPLTRADDPTQFQVAIYVFSGAAIVGVVLVLVGLFA